nr:transcriptional regulator [Proteus mirabilis]
MKTKPELFDVVDYLEDEEDIQAYLNAALDEDDE